MEYDWENDRYVSEEREFTKSWWFKTFYLNIFMSVMNYIFPIVTLCILTFLLLKSLKSANEARNEMVPVKHQKGENKGITKSLVAIIIIFLFCQLPHPALRLFMEIFHLGGLEDCNTLVFYFLPFIFIMPMLSSSANFFIYIVLRETFFKKLKSKFKRGKTHPTNLDIISTIQGGLHNA